MADGARFERAEGVCAFTRLAGEHLKPLGHPSINASTVVVETEGIEPPPSECKTDVLPLTPSPHEPPADLGSSDWEPEVPADKLSGHVKVEAAKTLVGREGICTFTAYAAALQTVGLTRAQPALSALVQARRESNQYMSL
jgi:hypothetical protein